MIRRIAVVLLLLASACSLASRDPRARLAAPGAAPGGALTIDIGRPATIDPANSFDRWGRFVDSLICDPLIQIDPVTGDLKPAIAESWVVSNGGSQITLKLRKDVRFANGSTMTADDVVYELSRVAGQEEASSVAELLRPIFGFGPFHGDVKEKNPDELSIFQGVRAIGTYAVQISLDRARADFLRVLAHPLSSPVPRATVTKDEATFETSPDCAGPYHLAHPWHPGDTTIELVRSPLYYGQNLGFTGGGRGYADRITLRVSRSAGAKDPLALPGAARADAAPAPDAPAGPGIVTGPAPYLEYIGLPPAVAPFDRRDVRVALSEAIDRAAIARDVYRGIRTPARGFLMPAAGSLYRPDACGSSAPAAADIAAARRALASAGVRMPPITLSYNPDFNNTALVTAVAAGWRAAFDVDVKLVAVPWDRYLSNTSDPRTITGPFRMGWQPPYDGPDPMLAPLFASASIGVDNRTLFSDPRFDRALNREARRSTDDADLTDRYERLEDIVCEQMPAIPIVFGGMRYSIRTDRIASAGGSFVDLATGDLLVRELYVHA
ncbi:MAG: ABC transporter substrate-binding protein [Actinomycetota bacterium]